MDALDVGFFICASQSIYKEREVEKLKKSRITAIFISLLLAIPAALPAYAEDEVDVVTSENAAPIIARDDVEVTPGSVVDLTGDSEASTVFELQDGSIVIKFRSASTEQYQSLFSVSNATAGNQDRHFHLYITPEGTLGMELRNTDEVFKYTMAADQVLKAGRNNTIAFKADSAEKNYKLFANGQLAATLDQDEYKFLSDITDLDNISLGGTVREGVTAYPFAGTIQSAKVYAAALTDDELINLTTEQVTEPEGLLLEQSDIDITEGSGYDLSGEAGAETVEELTKGTMIVSYTSTSAGEYQSLISIGNGTSGNQNRHFHLYVTNTGALGMELRNNDDVLKYTLSRPASLRGSYRGEYAANTVALKADKESGQYKLFANGELLATLDESNFKFISDITGVNNVTLGGTIRQNTVAYPFGGTIHNVKIYADVLSDEELISATAATTYGTNIFEAGDVTGANYFRIPTLLTLESGTVVSSADARYGGTHDAKSNIDIAFSKSSDSGNTWSEPILPFVFDDYAAQPVEWPRDSVGKNVQIQGSASFIDSVLLEDKTSNRLFMFVDAMPAGIGFSNTAAGSGFKTVGDKKYVKLRWSQDGSNTFNYTIRENGVIYDDTTNTPTEYTVDGNYNIKQNGEYLTQKQYQVHFEGTTLVEEKNDVDVYQNIFYKDSVFKVLATNFIVMKYSDDEGNTWSDMQFLGQFKADNQRVPLFGPGVGTQIQNGPHAGRMLVSMYNSISAEYGYLYSDDNGATWEYVTTDLGGSGTFAEAQIVELPDGTLQTYMRTSVGKIGIITSIDGGMTWTKQTFVPGMNAASYGTQLSVINCAQLVDGKPAIILSAPNATSGRRNGKIWVGLINDTGAAGYDKYTIDWKYSYSVDLDTYGFAYSCLAEFPDGNIGILYEKYDSWSRDELHLKNILKFESYSLSDLCQNSTIVNS